MIIEYKYKFVKRHTHKGYVVNQFLENFLITVWSKLKVNQYFASGNISSHPVSLTTHITWNINIFNDIAKLFNGIIRNNIRRYLEKSRKENKSYNVWNFK